MSSIRQKAEELSRELTRNVPPGTDWVCTWFGKVHRNPLVPSEDVIEVCFTPAVRRPGVEVGCSPASDWDASRARWIRTAVGLLPGLHLGQVWRDGHAVASLDCETESFKVRFGGGRTRIIGDGSKVATATSPESRAPVIPPDQYPIGRPVAHVAGQLKARLLSVRTDHPAERLLIPCTEILRFYYANSTRLSQYLFRGFSVTAPLDPPPHLDKIYNPDPEHTKISRGKKAKIQLRRHMLDEDATVIARLCFSDVARARALGVYAQMQKHAVDGATVVEAQPPFDGETTLRVHGLWLRPDVRGRPARYFLVLRIANCNRPFPFNDLEFSREFDHRAVSDGRTVTRERTPKRLVPADLRGRRGDPTHQDDEPTTRTRARKEVLAQSRFTALRDVSVKKVVPPQVRRRPRVITRMKPPERVYEGHSTGEGTGGDSPYDRLVLVNDALEGTDPGDEATDASMHEIATFALTVEELNRQSGMSLSYRFVEADVRATLGLDASVLPAPAGGVPSWLYLDPRTGLRRHVLIAQAEYDDRYFYLCELERRENETFKLLVFMRPDGAWCTEYQLRQVLGDCVTLKGIWKHWKPAGFVFKTLKHPPAALTQEEYVSQLERSLLHLIKNFD